MILRKGCPRCQGDMQHGYDLGGFNFLSCLQCGYRRYLDNGKVSQDNGDVVTMDIIEAPPMGIQPRSGSRLA